MTDLVEPLLRGQVEALLATRPLLLSLSAGIDSRTTLSLLRSALDTTTVFTYENPTSVGTDTDVAVAWDIASNLGFPIRSVHLPDISLPDWFGELLYENYYRPHSHALAWWYFTELPDDAVHLRSNLLEIGRTCWRKQPGRRPPLDPGSVARIFAPRSEELGPIEEAFADMVETTAFDPPEGYDPFDLLYWEHRMGTWHSTVVTESDVAHDTVVLFNSRAILDPLLSIRFHDRQQAAVYTALIERQWPVLLRWPINRLPTERGDRRGADLSDAHITGPDDDPTGGDGAWAVWEDDGRVTIWLDRSDPRQGDRAAVSIAIAATPGQAQQIQVTIESPYVNKHGRGRLHYEVAVDGSILYTEDIADWPEPNVLAIRMTPPPTWSRWRCPSTPIGTVSQPSHWGRAGRISVGPILVTPLPDGAEHGIVPTSPSGTLGRLPAE